MTFPERVAPHNTIPEPNSYNLFGGFNPVVKRSDCKIISTSAKCRGFAPSLSPSSFMLQIRDFPGLLNCDSAHQIHTNEPNDRTSDLLRTIGLMADAESHTLSQYEARLDLLEHGRLLDYKQTSPMPDEASQTPSLY